MIVATALPLLRKGAWWIRIFDFPRLQITLISAVTLAVLLAAGDRSSAWQNLLAALLALALVYQAYMMFPYTVLARRQVEDARSAGEDNTIALLFANVLMTNRDSQALLSIIREEEPDVILAVETDAWWQRELDVIAQTHRYMVRQPQDNTYGMLVYSRLELVDPAVKFLVQADVPSIHARVKLRSGALVELRCVHPRPPAPQEAKDAKPRDAELIVVGRELKEKRAPAVVLGDLNDVAWSRTNYRFQELCRPARPAHRPRLLPHLPRALPFPALSARPLLPHQALSPGELQTPAQVRLGPLPGSHPAELRARRGRHPAGTARHAAGGYVTKPVIAIHGGAGVMRRDKPGPANRAGLERALDAGYEVLKAGGSAIEAVTAAVVVLEDDPLFNAGRGGSLNTDGDVEMDASIMEGAELRAGAVAAVRRIRNPVLAARAVMEKTRHVLLAGDGAERFARKQGLKLESPAYFRTPRQVEALKGNRSAITAQSAPWRSTRMAISPRRPRPAAIPGRCRGASATRRSSAPAPMPTIAPAQYRRPVWARLSSAQRSRTTCAHACATAGSRWPPRRPVRSRMWRSSAATAG